MKYILAIVDDFFVDHYFLAALQARYQLSLQSQTRRLQVIQYHVSSLKMK